MLTGASVEFDTGAAVGVFSTGGCVGGSVCDGSVGGGCGVSVSAGTGVGGTAVLDGIGVGLAGICVAVEVATDGSLGPRVLVGGMEVRVGEADAVDVLVLLGEGEIDDVSVGVGVNTY